MKHLSKKDKKRLKVVKLLNQINSRFIDWIDTREYVDIFPVFYLVFLESVYAERFYKIYRQAKWWRNQ